MFQYEIFIDTLSYAYDNVSVACVTFCADDISSQIAHAYSIQVLLACVAALKGKESLHETPCFTVLGSK
jgi:hypothetical protein